jgi:hypothetical protein
VCLWPQVLSMQCAGTILSYVVYPAEQYVSILSKNSKSFEKTYWSWNIYFELLYDSSFQTNQPTRCNTFTGLLLDVHMWLNMFQTSSRPSSGAYHCSGSLWFYREQEAAGALLIVFWPVDNRPDHKQQRSSHFLLTVETEVPTAVVCSWWWAGRRLKYVEPYMNFE